MKDTTFYENVLIITGATFGIGHQLVLQLSARAYRRILKLARTIADLAASKHIQPAHLVGAPQLKSKMMESNRRISNIYCIIEVFLKLAPKIGLILVDVCK